MYFFKSKFNGDLHLDCHRSFTEKRSTIALMGHSWSEIELHGVYWNQNNNKKKRGKKEEDEKERFNNGIQYDIDIDLNYYNNNYLHKYIFIHRIKEDKDTQKTTHFLSSISLPPVTQKITLPLTNCNTTSTLVSEFARIYPLEIQLYLKYLYPLCIADKLDRISEAIFIGKLLS